MNDARQADGKGELEGFFARNRPRLVALARRILRDEHEAEDIVQETLVSALRRGGQEPLRNVPAYVARAVELNALKALARRRTPLPLDDRLGAVADEEDDDDEIDIDPFVLEQALCQLPPAQQTVVRMKFYMGYTFRQIGEVLAISMNTAASRCRYALATLRERLIRRQS